LQVGPSVSTGATLQDKFTVGGFTVFTGWTEIVVLVETPGSTAGGENCCGMRVKSGFCPRAAETDANDSVNSNRILTAARTNFLELTMELRGTN